MKPSPPSAIGQMSISASGSVCRIPWAIASAASSAVREPLNLSGAIRKRRGMKNRILEWPASHADAACDGHVVNHGRMVRLIQAGIPRQSADAAVCIGRMLVWGRCFVIHSMPGSRGGPWRSFCSGISVMVASIRRRMPAT